MKKSIINSRYPLTYVNIQNTLAIKRILKFLEITNKNESISPTVKTRFWKNFGPTQILAYITIISTLVAGFMNWNKEIITTQIAEIQAQKNEKIKLQRELSAAILETRILILNQNTLCKNENLSSNELKIERRNSLKQVVTLNGVVRSIFGTQSSDTISELVTKIYGITDVCSLDGEKYDNQLQNLYRKARDINYDSINKNTDEIELLMKKRHLLEIPIKI